MSLKTKIKNDLWRINYIIPFSHRYQFDEKGKVYTLKRVIASFCDIKLIKTKGKRTIGSDTKKILSCSDITIDNTSHFVYFIDTHKTIAVPGNVLSNFTLAYDKIIHETFDCLVKRAEGADEYGSETALVADGIRILAKRIIMAVQNSKYSAEDKQRITLYFERMFSKPADHFDEGLQRILFFNQILWQTRHRLNGLGRLDKILGDLYTKDINDGWINKEIATELVFDFMLQLSKYPEYKSDALAGDIGQIIILGGLEPDGTYFFNDLTEIFLKQQARLGKPDPKTFLRVSSKTPKEIVSVAVKCLEASTGSPLFSNDDVIIPALLDYGMPAEDANSYCTSACWEPFIVGKSIDQNNIGVFDYFSALDEVMKEEITSFDELLNKYKKVNVQKFELFLNDINQMKWAKDPLVSLFTEGCSENRKDISEGSCKYVNYGVTTVALSNTIDSILNIKKLVFEDKRVSFQELNNARQKNYEGYEELFNEIKRLPKHYGHDEDEVINLVNDITSSISEKAKGFRNVFGGTVKFGLSSPGYNILGKKAPADVAGRKAGMPYNTHISCLDVSYTEVVNFASHLFYDKQRYNGNVVDFFMTPAFLSENSDKFTLFIIKAIQAGFFQMQMNILDSKTLIDAKAHPENYKGLIVRVWGFSAYFNELPESFKDLLIDRAIAAETRS